MILSDEDYLEYTDLNFFTRNILQNVIDRAKPDSFRDVCEKYFISLGYFCTYSYL